MLTAASDDDEGVTCPLCLLNDPLPGMKESFAYMRGVLAGMA